MIATEVNVAKLRAWWFHRQGLDGRLQGKGPTAVLSETGWARSVGGVGPYLTLFSRAGIARQAADEAVKDLQIHELPAARGCTYVVPRDDFALALRAGGERAADMRLAEKLGVSADEVDRLCDAVLKALQSGEKDPEEIRKATGNASRSLGEEGKKKGMTTTLPLALGKLQSKGAIRRVPISGRLDQQRYKYCLWTPNPTDGFSLTDEEVATELASRFFRWAGPAPMSDFQEFSALGVNAAKAAVAPLGLAPVAPDSHLMMLPEDLDAFEDFRIPKEPQYAAVSCLDCQNLLRKNPDSVLDAEDARRTPAAVFRPPLEHVSHGIYDRGRLVGFWDYDTSTESIAWASFIPKDAELTATMRRMEDYVREQLGDARSFSLDSPKSRAPRIEALRAMG